MESKKYVSVADRASSLTLLGSYSLNIILMACHAMQLFHGHGATAAMGKADPMWMPAVKEAGTPKDINVTWTLRRYIV